VPPPEGPTRAETPQLCVAQRRHHVDAGGLGTRRLLRRETADDVASVVEYPQLLLNGWIHDLDRQFGVGKGLQESSGGMAVSLQFRTSLEDGSRHRGPAQ
jgi:hypothetical protein